MSLVVSVKYSYIVHFERGNFTDHIEFDTYDDAFKFFAFLEDNHSSIGVSNVSISKTVFFDNDEDK